MFTRLIYQVWISKVKSGYILILRCLMCINTRGVVMFSRCNGFPNDTRGVEIFASLYSSPNGTTLYCSLLIQIPRNTSIAIFRWLICNILLGVEIYTPAEGALDEIRFWFTKCFRLSSQNCKYTPSSKFWILLHYLQCDI